MGNLAFLAAFLALPVVSFLLVRSLTWTVAAVTGSLALAGAVVAFALDHGNRWTMASLQWVTLGALLAVALAALLQRRRGLGWTSVPLARQLGTVVAPVAVGFLLIAVSRLAAAPRSGLFTGVGFLVQRQYAEDNAKWLDFSSQLITGHDVVQSVPLGGPLQLFMVIVATVLASISVVAFGGVNEIFVAANTVVYAEYALAALAPFALAPIAEARVRARDGASRRGFIPAPLVWTGMLVLVVGSLAVSGLGHLTLQFVFIAVAFWVSLFLVGTRAPHAYSLASLAMVAVAIVWFPLTPISVLVLAAGVVVIVGRFARSGIRREAPWAAAVMWLAMIVLTWTSFTQALRYMTDVTSVTATSVGGGGGGRASASAFVVRSLDLLTSQGGTEVIAAALGVLVVLSAVLGTMFIVRQRAAGPRSRTLVAFAPAALVGAYAVVLSVAGTWWAGSGPAYGALKSTYMASIVVLAVSMPFALMEIDRKKAGLTVVRVAGIAGVLYLLTIDSLMPRAFTYLSPQQWPSAATGERGYWWPAEVKSQADQPISGSPIACGYFVQGAQVPSALPNGQTAYSCTRILVGLAGADTTGQPVVDWQRREWLTNTPAWFEEYPGLSGTPEDVRRRNVILMNEINEVVGLDSLQTFLDRVRPEWAWDNASG